MCSASEAAFFGRPPVISSFEEARGCRKKLRLSPRTKKKNDIEIAQLRDAIARTKRSADAQIAAAQLESPTAQKERDQSERQLNFAMARTDQDGVLTWVLPEVGATVRKDHGYVQRRRSDSCRHGPRNRSGRA
jgi:hypothetical protein